MARGRRSAPNFVVLRPRTSSLTRLSLCIVVMCWAGEVVRPAADASDGERAGSSFSHLSDWLASPAEARSRRRNRSRGGGDDLDDFARGHDHQQESRYDGRDDRDSRRGSDDWSGSRGNGSGSDGGGHAEGGRNDGGGGGDGDSSGGRNAGGGDGGGRASDSGGGREGGGSSGSARANGGSGNRDGKDDVDAADSDEPPATVEQLIKNLIKPQDTSAPATAASPATKPSTATTTRATATSATKPKRAATDKGTKRPASRPATAAAAYVGFDPMDLPRPGVLAVGLSGRALDDARAKGFRVESAASMTRLDMSLKRLVPPPGMSLAEGEELLRTIEPAARIGLNQKYVIYRPQTGAPDPAAGAAGTDGKPCDDDHCYGRSVMGWSNALGACARRIPVGVIDTAADTSHPALRSNRHIEVKRLAAGTSPAGENWHGTGILALLAGKPGTSTPGLIPETPIFLADVFFGDSKGAPTTDTVGLLEALEWLHEKKVKIVNMSLAGPPDDLVESAIERMAKAGVVFVAAAGNNGPGSEPSYPAAYKPVIAVTAVDRKLNGYRYANQGDYIDLAAPGVSVWTALPGGKTGYHSGTSFAVPYVTSVVAAAYDRLAEKAKPAILDQLTILDLGEPGPDQIFGRGLVMAPQDCHPSRSVDTADGTRSTTVKMQAGALGGPGRGADTGEVLPWLTPAGGR